MLRSVYIILFFLLATGCSGGEQPTNRSHRCCCGKPQDRGSADTERIDKLLVKAQSADIFQRSAATEELVEVGKSAVPKIAIALDSVENWEPAEALLSALLRIGVEESTFNVSILRWAKHDNLRVRRLVVAIGWRTLANFVPFAESRLTDKDWTVRLEVALGLGFGQGKPVKRAACLAILFNDAHIDVIIASINSFERLAEVPSDALERLSTLCTSERPEIRSVAVTVATKHLLTRSLYAEAKALLKGALQDSDASARKSAIRDMGLLGEYGSDLVGILVGAVLGFHDPGVEDGSLVVVGKMGRRALEGLLSMAKDDSSDVRRYIAKALGAVGERSTEVVAALQILAADADKQVREAALVSMRALTG